MSLSVDKKTDQLAVVYCPHRECFRYHAGLDALFVANKLFEAITSVRNTRRVFEVRCGKLGTNYTGKTFQAYLTIQQGDEFSSLDVIYDQRASVHQPSLMIDNGDAIYDTISVYGTMTKTEFSRFREIIEGSFA